MKLFHRNYVVGVFRGFKQGGLEFHAEITLPYRNDFQSVPMHGQFVLVQLESEDEGVLGRITAISSEGRLSEGGGEDYGIRAMSDGRDIPEELRENYLKYRVDIRILGVVKVNGDKLVFSSSHRRLPHVGSKVAFLSDEVQKEIAGHNQQGADLGFLSFGEFVYCGKDDRCKIEPWMNPKEPAIIPKYPINSLVSRRTFIFARAGFGKSNMTKLLFSTLYHNTPLIEKRGGREVPVGTMIFDVDGEYYWPDDKGRPGLCDVPELEDDLVVFTEKEPPSSFYGSFVAGKIKIDIRRLKPADVVAIALPPERQDQQNVRKLKSLNSENWRRLVDEIHRCGNMADRDLILQLLHLEDGQEAEMAAARANMTSIVKMLHDPSSQMMDKLIASLKAGKLCIIDVSMMRGEASLIISGIIMQKIFEYNQLQFTKASPQTIPTIVVIEEAQSVLGGNANSAPYVTWVKEGRKYDLGAVMITQQPGSIDTQLLSQGDNWFVFHLLSANDLYALKKANAHFSDDILSTLLNEPIIGNGIFWSSAMGRSYPIPVRVLSFEKLHQTLDPEYKRGPADTFALKLNKEFDNAIEHDDKIKGEFIENSRSKNISTSADLSDDQDQDLLDKYIISAFVRLKKDPDYWDSLRERGKPWIDVQNRLMDALPKVIDENERRQIAYNNVRLLMDDTYGKDNWTWDKRKKATGEGMVTWLTVKPSENH
ncbi:MAG: AAA-like domain protein [Methanomassiliicoccales archaeon PtaB.Bin215]|nr:MAG: AAA-like domain protein [Methanomassiliicoccales archaeon PtaB.Bin215]